MTDIPQIGTGLTDIHVETGIPSAPVEQQSTETIKPEIKVEMSGGEPDVQEETIVEPAKPSAEDKANDTARLMIEQQIRADRAEAELKKLQPKISVPDKAPDINDQKTWGDKYKDAPNDLETFLQARDDWAIAQGEKRARDQYSQAEQQRAMEKIRIDVATRDQAARLKYADYDAVLNPILPALTSSPYLKDFLMKNPMGADVAYELGKNPAILQTLLKSDPWATAEQLINMAARLKKPAAPQITNAPEPITPVGSRETIKPKVENLAAKSDLSDYMAMMNKRDLARRRSN